MGQSLIASQFQQFKEPIYMKLSLLLFLQFFIWGVWYVSLPKYVSTVEYMGPSTFFCYSAIPIAAMIAPFFLGLVADRFFNTEVILGLLFFLAGICQLLLPEIANLTGNLIEIQDPKTAQVLHQYSEVSLMGISLYKHQLFNWMLLAHSLFYMPTLALSASLCFSHLKDGSRDFPLVRLWGTFGWIAGGLVLIIFNSTGNEGQIIAGESKAIQFYMAGGACLLLGVFCFFLPRTPAPQKGRKVDVRALFFMDVWREFKNFSFAIFVICSFALSVPLQAYYAFLQSQMGAQGFVNYAHWKNAGTWLEAGMMFAMPFFFRKLGIKKMILVGIAAWMIRYILFSQASGYGVMDSDNFGFFGVEWAHMGFLLIMGGVLLHGICYDFFFVSGQIYVDQTTDKKIRGQAQSMIVFFTQGLGMYVGAELINKPMFIRLFDPETRNENTAYGNAGSPDFLNVWPSFWMTLVYITVAIFLVFIFCFRENKKQVKLSH